MSTSQKNKGKEPEIVDTTGDPDSSDSDGEEQEHHKVAEEASAPSTSTSQKKKKKKKSKGKKLLNAIRGNDGIPQEVVDQVLDKVKAEGGPGSSEANAENVRLALQEMKIMDVVKGKAGVGGLNKKDLGEHKVFFFVILVIRIACAQILCSVLGHSACSTTRYFGLLSIIASLTGFPRGRTTDRGWIH
jgi:glycylpeptide N-tetradecanoyltransferase